MMLLQSSTPEQNATTIRPALGAKVALLHESWRDGHRQAKKDFYARWRPCGIWCLAGIWLAALVLGLTSLISGALILSDDSKACTPDGSFTVDPSTYRYFSGSGFFEITLGFGALTFTQAKVIDVVWDVVVGRGGQAVVTYISWHIFANYVTTSMEVMPVTFRTYRTIFLPGGSLLVEIPRLIRDFCSRHALHSRLAMIFMVFTMAFTLAFPTLLGALAGYQGNVDAFVRVSEDNQLGTPQDSYIPFTSFSYAYFVIHDGWRVGLEGNHIITEAVSGQGSPSLEPTLYDGDPRLGYCFRYYYNEIPPPSCYLQTNITDYIRAYGFDGKNNVTSTFMGHELQPPVLSISAFFLPYSARPSSLKDFGFDRDSPYADPANVRWMYGNKTYTQTDLRDRGRCQPTSNYQWGFSFIQTFIMLILLLIWSIGIYTMWLHSHIIMKRRGGPRDVAGEHKAVLELAHAMHQQHVGLDLVKEEKVGDASPTTTTASTTTAAAIAATVVTEAQLRRRVAKELRGGSISYAAPLLTNGETAEDKTIRAWVKRNKWSIAGMLWCLVLTTVGGFFAYRYIILLIPLPLELGVALYIGSTRKSRGVIFFWAFVLLSVLPQIILTVVTLLLLRS